MASLDSKLSPLKSKSLIHPHQHRFILGIHKLFGGPENFRGNHGAAVAAACHFIVFHIFNARVGMKNNEPHHSIGIGGVEAMKFITGAKFTYKFGTHFIPAFRGTVTAGFVREHHLLTVHIVSLSVSAQATYQHRIIFQVDHKKAVLTRGNAHVY